jgi:acyl-CoA synthetase (AMP-forming)/AMP-acid ligase II
MLRLPDFDAYDLSAVKAVIVGGGRSSPALIEEARRRFEAAYSVRYSSTESGGVGTLTAFDAPDEEALYTVGRPRDGIDLVVRDGNGNPVPAGEVGEVTLRSPAVMSEYWNDPENTAQAIRDGWLWTQDLGFIDPGGCLRLVGRSKEMFIRGGYNVYPLEVEAVLAAHPGVAEVAVVPRPDDVMGEIGVAVVVPSAPDDPPTLEDLRAFAAESLAAYKLPEAIRIVAELPLTDMHKVDRLRLQGEASAV